MEIMSAARSPRVVSLRLSNNSSKRFRFAPAAGAFFALIAVGALGMTDAQAIAAVGAVAGTGGVSADGAAIYTIPISLPPGTGGVQPTVALSYDSQSGEGLAGYGWTLSGLSAITRCPMSIEDDGQTQAIQFQVSDDYCLDGQRLRLVSGAYGADGATYSTQIETFSRITSHVDSSAGNGPSWFTVQSKDGTAYEYGNTSDSKVMASSAGNAVRVWALDKVTDLNGNFMTYQYGGSPVGSEYWPTSINYTGNGGTAPDHQVEFDYKTRPAGTILAGYVHGSLVTNSQLLSAIKVNYAGAATFTYTLSYGQDPANKRNQLTAVRVCAADGTCMPQTTIAWQSAQAGWQADVSTGSTVAQMAYASAAHLIDVDGDGIQDLLYPNTAGSGVDWYVMFGVPAGGFTAPVDTGIAADPNYFPYAVAIDFDGSGRQGLLVPQSNGSTWQILVPTGNRTAGAGGIFTAAANNLSITGTNSATGWPIYHSNTWTLDSYGRGLSDVGYTDGLNLYVMKNNGSGSGPAAFAAPQLVYTVPSGDKVSEFSNGSEVDVPVDFDGSGKGGAGLSFQTPESGDLPYTVSVASLYAPSAQVSQPPASFQIMGQAVGFQSGPMDANGDGLSDLLFVCQSISSTNDNCSPTPGLLNSNEYFQIGLSTGTGFVTLPTSVYGFGAFDMTVDYYGDGRQEAIVQPSGWQIIQASYTPGSGYSAVISNLTTAPLPSNYFGGLQHGNIEANGLDDLVYIGVNSGCHDVIGSGWTDCVYTWHYELHAPGTDLVTSISDGLGNVTQFQYASLASGSPFYTKGSSAQYPVRDIQPAMLVVQQYAESDGTGGVNKQIYSYSGAQSDSQGRGFLGFASRTITDVSSGTTETISYSQTFPSVGLATADVVTRSSDGAPVRQTINSGNDQLTSGSGNNTLYYPFFDISTTTVFDFNGGSQTRSNTTTTLAATDFDPYGNVVTQQSSTTDGATGQQFASAINTAYASANAASYCVGLVQQVTEQRTSSAGSLSRVTDASSSGVDTNFCRLKSETQSSGQDDGTLPLTTQYQYDAYGNVIETDVSGSGLATRTTDYSFQGGNGEFPVSATRVVSGTQSLTTHTSWRYDLGLKTSDTDANGLVTNYGYDGFGRVISITRPDGVKIQTTYAWCSQATPGVTCPANAVYEVTDTQIGTDGTAINLGYTAYDMKGRKVEQGTVLLGGAMSLVDTTYDSAGHVLDVTRPHFSGQSGDVYQTTYAYDEAFDRLIQIMAPVNAGDTGSSGDVTTFSYGVVPNTGYAVTVTHTAAGISHATTKYTDALGELTQVLDADGATTSDSYDAFGDLITSTDANDNVTSTSYDGLGHKIAVTDPNMGRWTYQLDALGEILCQTDAKGQSIIMGYDDVGRVTSKLETAAGAGCTATSGTSSAWTYDTQTKGIGLPASVVDSNGFERDYDYDSLGRMADVTTTPGAGASQYTLSTTYDNFGRVQTVTYPASVTPTTTGAGPAAVATITPGPVTVGTAVTLDGSGSTPAGVNLQYQWAQTGGPTVGLGALDTAGVTTSFTPAIGGVYGFQLQVIDGNSALSAPASVSVIVKPLVPATLTVTSAVADSGVVALSWQSVVNVSSYDLYQSTDNQTFTLVMNVADTGTGTETASVTNLVNGTYYFAIQAKANGVNSNQSPSVSAQMIFHAPTPTGLSDDGDPGHDGTYAVNWNSVTATGTTITYDLEQATGNSSGAASSYSSICTGAGQITSSGGTSSCSVSHPGNGSYYYYYKVRAHNVNGYSAFSAVDSIHLVVRPGVPGAFSPASQSNHTGSFTISWAAASGPVSYYQMFQDTSTSFSSETWDGNTTTTSESVSEALGTWYFRVRACNSSDGTTVCSGWDSYATATYTAASGGGGGCPPPPYQCQLVLNDGIASTQIVAPAPGDNALLPIEETAASPVVLRAVAAPIPPNAGPDVLLALASRRQELLGYEHLQPMESGLQARFDRLRSAMPQTIAMTQAGAGLHAGTPVYAPPVYQAYAGSTVKAAAATPYRFTVQYNYDPSSGSLLAVSNADTGFIYWRAATDTGNAPVDAFGHVIAYVDGNNVSTVSSYDQATGVITGISTGVGQSSAIQQLAYSWDGFGNLQSRCDANRGLTETFQYDRLNRMSSSIVNTGASNCTGGSSQAALSMGYDAVGNITNRSNTGITVGSGTLNDSYTYGDPSHPYAVTGVTSIPGTYSYDANGNMLSGNGRTISWNDDNLPVSISSTGTQNGNLVVAGSSTFAYSPDKQRYSQATTDSVAGNSSTTYISNLFEVVTTSSSTQYRHNIMAVGHVVAVHTLDQSGNATTTYVHTDNLDSGDAITDDTGNIATDPVTGQQQVMSFDAFGLRRDPNSWAYDLTSTQVSGLKAKTDRGYTSQEQLDNVGLVHMNGRVFDPGIGRFISADPMVSGGRYTYLDDNPLNDTDPTGYCGGLWGGSCFGSSSPLNPVTGPINVAKQAVSAATGWLSSLAPFGFTGKMISFNFNLAKDFGSFNWKIGAAGFKLGVHGAVAGFDLQRKIAWDYTRGVRTWTRNSINFALHPAMNVEYSLPGVGNELNNVIRRSSNLQLAGTIVASVLSDVWGPEISAGWSAYVDDLHGDSALGVSESFVTSYAISAGANAAGNYYNCGTSCADSTGWFSYTQGSFAAEDADALYNGGGIFPAFDDLSADIYFAGDFAETTVVQSALANKKSLFGDAKRFFGIGGN
jgi:RHS repeat-associated protein